MKKEIFITESETIIDALKKLDKSSEKVLLVVEANRKLLGTITDGDIRRYVLSGRGLENGIKEVYQKKSKYIRERDYDEKKAKKILLDNQIELLPIVNDSNTVINYVTWSQLFSEVEDKMPIKEKLDVYVAIMAGGKGTRLEPFTRILPKPLIPLGNKPIVEIIIDEFKKHGIYDYYLTLNYKGEMIESYFNNIEKDYKINYIKEEEFLGTAGSLKLLKDKITDNFIVSNCDVIVRADFKDVVDFHVNEKACLTVLSAIKHYRIPYGVTNFKEGGKIVEIIEKPEFTFTINTGVYVLNKDVLDFIPENQYFDMTDLIKVMLKNKKNVITYPVNENDYIDIGQWKEYKSAVRQFNEFV